MNKIKTHKVVLTALLLVVAIAVMVVVYIVQNQAGSSSVNDASTAQPTKPEEAEQSQSYISYKATAGTTALEQLQAINDSVVVEESEYGIFVDSINGLKGGTDGKYWSFYIDGELATVGAGSYEPTGEEVIEWKFQKL